MNTSPKLKESDYLKAWGIFWVLSTFGGMIAGLVGGAILGFVLGGLGVRMHTIKVLCGALGFLLGLPISYIIFQFTIRYFVAPKLSASANASSVA